MKKLLTLCAFALLAVAAEAASDPEKIVERSASKAPAWIGIADADHIIVSAEEASLDEARKRCLSDIRQEVINSVCVYITSEESLGEKQVELDGASSISRQYESQLRTVAGRLPFITNISLSDAEIYWEKRLVKKEKRNYYSYHVRFPFSAERRAELIAEFQRQDREQYNKYVDLKNRFTTFTQVEDISRAVIELDQLHAYFFDDLRRNEVAALRQNYRNLYKEISVVPYANELGEHQFCFLLSGRKVTVAKKPRIKSQYATDVVVAPIEDNLYRVTYNYEQCLEEDDNRIELTYHVGGEVLKHSFSFDVRKDKMEVIPVGMIELDAKPIANSTDSCSHLTAWINLRSKYEGAFEVREIWLMIDGLDFRIDGTVKQRFEGKGNHRFEVRIKKPFTLTSERSVLCKGALTLYNVKTGKSEEVRIALPYKIRKQ